MTRDQEILAGVLRERGYLVVNASCHYQHGASVCECHENSLQPEQPLSVICETDVRDADVQQALLEQWGMPNGLWRFPFFYRVSTD